MPDTRCPRIARRQVSPLEKLFKNSMAQPYNTKQYAFNNSVNMRTIDAELQTNTNNNNKALGVFNAKRRSQQADMLNTTSNFTVLKDISTFFHDDPSAPSHP